MGMYLVIFASNFSKKNGQNDRSKEFKPRTEKSSRI